MNRFRKGILFCLLSVFAFSCLPAQEYVEGRVYAYLEGRKKIDRKKNLEEIPGARIFWAGTQRGTLSEADGSFRLERQAGDRQLVVQFLNYDHDTLTIEETNEPLKIILDRSWHLDELDAVEITDRVKPSGFARLDPKGVELIREGEFRKAACCNLAESFETNPSVDASFSDAVTGTRQIKMLGLSGTYVNITEENMPRMSGLAAVNGLSHVPTRWVSGLQLAKGTGSVVNGFEGLAGQINVEYRKPFDEESLILNTYLNQGGRYELNGVYNTRVSPKAGTSIMGHYSGLDRLNDRNQDGFLDMPRKQELHLYNRWKFESGDGVEGQLNVLGGRTSVEGGQANFFSNDQVASSPYYQFTNKVDQFQAFAKFGAYDQENPDKSIGSQWLYLYHDQVASFGGRRLDARQQSFYGNIISQYPLAEGHLIKAGFSLRFDQFREQIRWDFQDSLNFDRNERVPGIFTEYAFTPSPKWTLVAGIRGDVHNYYGTFFTPRLHLRYAPVASTNLRLSFGRGQRSPNVLTDNLGLLVSAREWEFDRQLGIPGYGLPAEVGWNIGFSVTQDFTLDYREGVIRAEAFRTQFTDQAIIDREQADRVAIYALDGRSFANSVLFEFQYELIRRLDLKLAYRWYDVQLRYRDALLPQIFTARHRAFANLGYRTRKKGFSFDYTVQWTGPQRVPNQEDSPSFSLMNAQVNKTFGEVWEVYLGGENLLDFRQENPILAADRPFSNDFDASLIWGPVFGRMIYVGATMTLRKKK